MGKTKWRKRPWLMKRSTSKYKLILHTKDDIIEELLKSKYVKGVKVKEIPHRTGLIDIYIRVGLLDFFFNRSKVLDKLHGKLRPKMPVTITYSLKLRLI